MFDFSLDAQMNETRKQPMESQETGKEELRREKERDRNLKF